jgi:predicted membrane channel-forming protein YqfA (hemolysin III family)
MSFYLSNFRGFAGNYIVVARLNVPDVLTLIHNDKCTCDYVPLILFKGRWYAHGASFFCCFSVRRLKEK